MFLSAIQYLQNECQVHCTTCGTLFTFYYNYYAERAQLVTGNQSRRRGTIIKSYTCTRPAGLEVIICNHIFSVSFFINNDINKVKLCCCWQRGLRPLSPGSLIASTAIDLQSLRACSQGESSWRTLKIHKAVNKTKGISSTRKVCRE